MTALPAETRRELRAALRANAGKWIARFYRHELLTARTVVGMQIEAQQEFDRTVVRPLLKEIGGRLATFDARGQDVIAATYPELADLEREIQRIVDRGSDAVRRLSAERLDALTRHESDWVADSARKVLGVEPVQPTLAEEQEAAARPVLGKKVEEWFSATLAGSTGDKVRAWVATGIQRGLTTDEIVRGLRGTKSEAGILDAPRHTVAAIVRTAATHVSAQARMTSFAGIGVTRWRFVATLDHRTSIQCAANDGKTFPLGEGPVPPLHPNAVLAGSTFIPYGRLEEFVHAGYRGECVHIQAGGYRSTIGPNHPMLTSRGMVKAAQLRKGDKLLRDLRHDGAMGLGRESDLKQVPMVQDVLGSLFAGNARSSVSTSGHDLHGDVAFCHGEIGVVVPDRFLLPVLDSEGIEHLRELGLVGADVAAKAIAGPSAGLLGGYGVNLPPAGGMRCADSWVAADLHWVWVDVVGVEDGFFVGEAFDATTESSLYCSDGFVVSNCRSTPVPDFGDPIGTRAATGGQVDATTTFPEWLRGQPASEQDRVLGITRAAAWRAGDLTIEQMLGRDLQPLTIRELRAMDRIE